jgi:Lsr2
MARTVEVIMTCDMPHYDDETADETIRFAIQGVLYEIDTCKQHGEDMAAAFGAVTVHARVVYDDSRPATSRSAVPARTRPKAERMEKQAIRDWAATRLAETKDPKYVCANNGRIPHRILALYTEETA